METGQAGERGGEGGKRERISGETWDPEMAFARVTKEVYLLSADRQDYFRTL